jgi:hypothetical protein
MELVSGEQLIYAAPTELALKHRSREALAQLPTRLSFVHTDLTRFTGDAEALVRHTTLRELGEVVSEVIVEGTREMGASLNELDGQLEALLRSQEMADAYVALVSHGHVSQAMADRVFSAIRRRSDAADEPFTVRFHWAEDLKTVLALTANGQALVGSEDSTAAFASEPGKARQRQQEQQKMQQQRTEATLQNDYRIGPGNRRPAWMPQDAQYSAIMCRQCRVGPLTHTGCAARLRGSKPHAARPRLLLPTCSLDPCAPQDLRTHHRQEVQQIRFAGRPGHVNNACPGCGWFSQAIQDWLPWDGVLRTGIPPDAAETPPTTFDLWLCAGLLGRSPEAEVDLLRAVATAFSKLLNSLLEAQGVSHLMLPEREKFVDVLRCWNADNGPEMISRRSEMRLSNRPRTLAARLLQTADLLG